MDTFLNIFYEYKYMNVIISDLNIFSIQFCEMSIVYGVCGKAGKAENVEMKT